LIGETSRPNSAVTTFSEPCDFQRTIRGTDLRVVLNTPGDYHAELTRIDLHPLWIQDSWQSLGQIVHFALPRDRVAVHFLADAHHAPVFLDGMEVSSDDLICYCPGAEHHFRTVSRSSWMSMSLPMAVLAEIGLTVAGQAIAAPRVTRLIRLPPSLMARLRSLHESAAHLARNTPDILAHLGVAKAVEQQLIHTMVACLTADAAMPVTRRLVDSGAVMRRFESAVLSRQYEPIYLPELCAELGVSDRTLRLHCQEHLGMSPYRYLWLRRMHLVHRALALAEPALSSVTAIALDHGFGELGRFAVEYRKLFGETPRTTLHRAPVRRSGPAGQYLTPRVPIVR
jgi:AraC-like DNA-binding protein